MMKKLLLSVSILAFASQASYGMDPDKDGRFRTRFSFSRTDEIAPSETLNKGCLLEKYRELWNLISDRESLKMLPVLKNSISLPFVKNDLSEDNNRLITINDTCPEELKRRLSSLVKAGYINANEIFKVQETDKAPANISLDVKNFAESLRGKGHYTLRKVSLRKQLEVLAMGLDSSASSFFKDLLDNVNVEVRGQNTSMSRLELIMRVAKFHQGSLQDVYGCISTEETVPPVLLRIREGKELLPVTYFAVLQNLLEVCDNLFAGKIHTGDLALFTETSDIPDSSANFNNFKEQYQTACANDMSNILNAIKTNHNSLHVAFDKLLNKYNKNSADVSDMQAKKYMAKEAQFQAIEGRLTDDGWSKVKDWVSDSSVSADELERRLECWGKDLFKSSVAPPSKLDVLAKFLVTFDFDNKLPRFKVQCLEEWVNDNDTTLEQVNLKLQGFTDTKSIDLSQLTR